MKKAQKQFLTPRTLRRTAEKRFKEDNIASGWPKKEEDILRLLYELEVHQLELKLQNEQLQWAREDLENRAGMYHDLWEFAPVGYFTLSYLGIITAVNLAGASLLQLERSRLIGRPFHRLLASEAVSDFNQLFKKVIESGEQHSCDLPLPKDGERQSFVRMEMKISKLEKECWAVAMDITESRLAKGEPSEKECI